MPKALYGNAHAQWSDFCFYCKLILSLENNMYFCYLLLSNCLSISIYYLFVFNAVSMLFLGTFGRVDKFIRFFWRILLVIKKKMKQDFKFKDSIYIYYIWTRTTNLMKSLERLFWCFSMFVGLEILVWKKYFNIDKIKGN